MKVFYRPEQTAEVRGLFSPSMYKPALVVADWQERFKPEMVSFEPVTRAQLSAVHDPRYVQGVLDLELDNGFDGRQRAIADSLPFTSGSMVAAALAAWREGGITCSPTSGFHHARYARGGGFCTFNGLMVAVVELLQAGADTVGIMDLDMHYGDGTVDIIHRLGLKDRVQHFTLGAKLRGPDDEQDTLAEVQQQARQMAAAVDVILYQAGADSHAEDPLGGVFSTEGYALRDEYVFSAAREARTPVAWNLAGGYQTPVEKVIALHGITYRAATAAGTGQPD